MQTPGHTSHRMVRPTPFFGQLPRGATNWLGLTASADGLLFPG